ncbi:hypothetical protein [Thermaurantimonas aggregans]|uniref:hypothetical protein n=1 Tax=Thermaurantimonas aggregans TaxID=2173829 RepID=UPI0013569027|nr:hypothetical protein [Thermaurantimonas aggregans]MCX8148085.1 hypothetical protein [Thermaurantimonas aggregans]
MSRSGWGTVAPGRGWLARRADNAALVWWIYSLLIGQVGCATPTRKANMSG